LIVDWGRREVEIRRARPSDVDDIAAAHLDSIRSIGPRYYDPDIVDDWGAQITGELRRNDQATP